MKNPRKSRPELAPATISEFDGVRFLHLGTIWVQGAMRLRKPHTLELEYIRRMMVWMLFRPPAEITDGHAVQLGLGAAAITRFCHGPLAMRTTAVELNPSVIDACRQFFRLPAEAENLQVLNMDAADYAADPNHHGTVQVLCVDLYDHDAASPVLDSADFYVDCARLLADGGVMTVNLFGRDASFARSAAHIAAAFGADRVRSLQPTKEGNAIVVALKNTEVPEHDELAARADTIEARFKLPANQWLRRLKPLLPAPKPRASAPKSP